MHLFELCSLLCVLMMISMVADGAYKAGCVTNGGAEPNKACVFPFKYNGIKYGGCTDVDYEGTLWCSTEVDFNGKYIEGHWGNCEPSCHIDTRECVNEKSLRIMAGGPDACETKPHSKPWMANLAGDCGGTLIGSKYVLTAAHCVCWADDSFLDCKKWKDLGRSYVIMGDHDEDSEEDIGEVKINIVKVIVPEVWNGRNNDADYAILVLQNPPYLWENVKIAKLPPKNAKCPPGLKMVVSGWGDDWFTPRPTNKLWAVLQASLPMNRCPQLGDRHEKYSICGGDPKEDDNSACHGDSGGPLTYTDYTTGETTLYGVVSGLGGNEMCLSTTLYARVAEPGILDWIRAHTDAA